jgi:hypothetical protein
LELKQTKYPNCVVEFSDGSVQSIDARELLVNGLANWQGWECQVGTSRIVIEANLAVYSGECLNDKLGDLQTGWELMTGPAICRRKTCTGNVEDLYIDKQIVSAKE